MINRKLHSIDINFLIRDEDAFYDIYIKLGSKEVKYASKDSDNREELIKLKSKGIEKVLICEDSYKLYLEKRTKEKEKSNEQETKQNLEILEEFVKDRKLIREVFSDFGLSSDKLQFIQELSNKNINFLKQNKSLADVFSLYSNIPETSVVKKQMEIFFCVQMLESVAEFKAGKYAEKVSLAILISDVLLTEEEYWTSFSSNLEKITEDIRNHPKLIADKIGENILPLNVICMIRQHHEKPDGSGYPNGLNCNNINIFAAYYIIAEDFVSMLLRVKMRSNEIQSCIDQINKKYCKYLNCSFERGLASFNKIIKNDKCYVGVEERKKGDKNVA